MEATRGRAAQGFVLVVSLQPLDATTTFFFGQRLGTGPDTIRVVQYGRSDVASLLGAAAAVIIVRGLFELGDVARCARALRIPTYYFLDDNFIVLSEQGGIDAAFVGRYSVENVRAALRGFAAVLLSTPALMDWFAERRVHPRLWLFPPVAAVDRLAAPIRRARLHIAFFGGRHLHGIFLRTIVPAVRRLAVTHPVTLVAVGLPEPIESSAGLTVIHQPYDPSYERGLSALTAEGVDLLVHPVAPGMTNNAYKSPHALISAHVLGAVPIVSDAPPYDALRPEGVALFCDHTEDSWYQALVQAATNESLRSDLRARLAGYCANKCDGTLNRDVLNAILNEHRPPRRGWIPFRSGVARVCLLMGLSGRALSRVKRAIGPKTTVAAA